MRRRGPVRRRGVLRAWLCLLALLAAGCLGLKAADVRLRAQLYALAAARAFAVQESSLNSAVLDALDGKEYGELVHIVQNDAGQITSVQTDAVRLNVLKARVSAAAESALADSTQEVRIPVGSLTGLDILSGCGPSLHIKVRMSGFAAAEIDSAFESAGVNQTLHRLTVTVRAHVTLSMPHNTQQKDLTYPICIAETVIVGTVPQFYARTGNGE